MKASHIQLIFLFLFIGTQGLVAQSPVGIEFSPHEWKFGMISQGEIVRTEVTAINKGESPLVITFVPTCSCQTVSPANRSLKPGASATFALSYDSKDDEGKTNRYFIVKTDMPGAKPLYYLMGGVVRAERNAAGSGDASSLGAGVELRPGALGDSVELDYYYTPGCRSCEEFLSSELPKLEAGYGVRADLKRRDLMEGAAYEELDAFASSLGTKVRAIPSLRIGNILLQGDQEIRDRLPGILYSRAWTHEVSGTAGAATGAASGTAASAAAEKGSGAEASVGLAILPVIAAGLIDGINPCAFTTLIFLLASLALAGWGRRDVLAIGSLFTLGVFLTYFGVGFGLFAALRAASAIAIVGIALRWVLVAVLVAFAALSVYDYTRIKAGKSSEMLLQLPNSLKLRIHASIRARAKTAALAGSSFVLGIVISIFEFACTGQVYLPTLAYLARAKGRTDAVLLLLLYNLCFIAPLLVVFGASYLGVSSKRITQMFQKRMGAIKLGLAAVFLVLALLTLLT